MALFKRFDAGEDISCSSAVKSSVIRGIRSTLLKQYPKIENVLNELLPPKGGAITITKCSGKIQLICHDGSVLFFQERDGQILPTLRLLHKYPYIMSTMQVDRGAVKFVLNGSHIFCPGFRSPGGDISEEIEAGKPVCIMVEGKKNAIAVGITELSTADIRKQDSGVAVNSLHILRDGLWNMPTI